MRAGQRKTQGSANRTKHHGFGKSFALIFISLRSNNIVILNDSSIPFLVFLIPGSCSCYLSCIVVMHVALPSVVVMTSVAERFSPLIVKLIVRFLGNQSSMNPLLSVDTGLSIITVPDWSTALTLSFV
jgi:hypothetical protein